MAINGITSYYEKNKTLFRVLTEEQVENMILDAFEILEKTGVKSNDKISNTSNNIHTTSITCNHVTNILYKYTNRYNSNTKF